MRALLFAFVASLGVAHAAELRDADYAQGYFGEMLPGLSPEQTTRAENGFRLFIKNWSEGIGKHRNGDSCVACHNVPMPGGSGMSRQALVEIDAAQAPGSIPEVVQTGLSDLPGEPHGEVRRTPQLFGIGYLEFAEGSTGLGAFGKVDDLRTFVARAFAVELGVSNAVQCARDVAAKTYPQTCAPVLSNAQLDDVVEYLRFLAPPMRRPRPEAAEGADVFNALGCVACHQPTSVTRGDAPPPLADRRFAAYSDGRAHDIGARAPVVTAPLWGLNSMGPPYMHDACGQSIGGAIECHRGEAKSAADGFVRLPQERKNQLLVFLRSL